MKSIAIAHRLPWNNKAGRFSPLKATTLLLLSLPALWIAFRALFLGLGPEPIEEATHFMGEWTIYLLLLSLFITPARRLFNWSKLIQIRRMVGLAALYYILGHFTLFIADSGWDIWFVTKEVALRIYLTIGFAALLGLVVLGLTSFDSIVKRMGAVAWNRLHRIIYLIAGLGFLHYFLQSKADVSAALITSGMFFWLMGFRMLTRFRIQQSFVALVGVSFGAALLTGLIEAGWYQVSINRPGIGMQLFLANFDMARLPRPASWMLGAGLGLTLSAELWHRFGRTKKSAEKKNAASPRQTA